MYINNKIKMKMKTIIKLVSVVLFLGTFTACVQDDNYNIPADLGVVENKNLTALLANSTELTIQQVKDIFTAGSGEAQQITSNVYVKGYVSSSDESGNFYREFFIQDASENPTAAIKIAIDMRDIFSKYNFGREIYIDLKDLYVGEVRSGDGVVAIGENKNIDEEVINFRQNVATVKVLRSSLTETMVGLPLDLAGISTSNIGMFITVEAQFIASLAGELYVDSADSFDTTRGLEFCNGFDYSNFLLETSTFANFRNLPLPTNSGTISGVINNNYNGSYMVLALNDIADVKFNDTRCNLLDIANFSPLFTEDFEAMTNNATISGGGWTNHMETGGSNWRIRTSNDSGNSGSKIASMGAYNSGSPSNIAWLISPSIDLDAQGIEFLTFQTSNSFADGSELEVLISTDWDGTTANIATATWTILPANVVSDGEYYQNWVGSGSVELTSYSGTAYIAFKYIGGDNSSNMDGTYEIDNYTILTEI